MAPGTVLVPTLLVAFGAAGVYIGWKRRRVYALVNRTDPTAAGAVDPPEVVAVEGVAAPTDSTVEAPITGCDALVAAWTVEEWDERGDASTWREVARGIEAPPFAVDDGTGTVAVDAVSRRDTAGKWTQTTGVSASDGVRIDGAMVEFGTFPTRRELDPDADVPPRLRRLHEEHDLYEDTGSITNAVDIGTKHGARRYAEQVVEPGEEVYVLGCAREPERTDGQVRVRARLTEPDDGLLLLSDQDGRSLEREFAASFRSLLYGGAAAVVLGAGAFVALHIPV